MMKLELNAYEVLALYEHLLFYKSSYDYDDITIIREKLKDFILDSMLFQQTEIESLKLEKDTLFDQWEKNVKQQIAEKAAQTTSENNVADLFEEYDSTYPKSFKKSRNNRRKNKK